MRRPAILSALLAALVVLAAGGLAWGGSKALTDSADLLRRAEEVALFIRGIDPYDDPDMTYPPSALPVFTPLVAPFGPTALKVAWLLLNLAALATLCVGVVRLWGRAWPAWLRTAFILVVVAARPVRAGMALGQFHLVPLALVLLAFEAVRARRSVVAGLLVGVALAKPTMALPFLGLLAARRCWGALAVAIGTQGALLAGASAWLGTGPDRLVRRWLDRARSQEAAGTIDLPSLLHRAWPDAPVAPSQLALALLALGVAATLAWRRRSDVGLAAFCGFVAAVFTYHRHYDLVLLIPALAYLVDAARVGTGRVRHPATIAAVVFAAALIAPGHPSVTRGLERWYDIGFVPLAYVALGGIVLLLAAEPRWRGVE